MPITRAARANRANRANRTLLLNKIKFAFGSVVSEFLFNENSPVLCNKQLTT